MQGTISYDELLSLTNILFGIFTGVIKFYYICSCTIDNIQINNPTFLLVQQ